MKKLFEAADEYVRQSDWKDFALIKLCLAAIGILLGMRIPRKKRKPAMLIAGSIFAVTYVPLMIKFFRILLGKKDV